MISEDEFDLSDFDIDSLSYLHSDYINEDERLSSFKFWMVTDVSKQKLACAGFYHVKEDHVKCFACNVVVGNWNRGDDPFIEHFKHSSCCPFIKGEQTNNIPINEESLKKELTELCLLNSELNQTTKQINGDSKYEIIHPCYKTVEQRLETFDNWPIGLNQTPLELSRAGFFYLGTSDEVKCFCCGKCLKQWGKEDKPHEEHKRHFWQTCRFIRDFYKMYENKTNHGNSVKAATEQMNYLHNYMNSNQELANNVINISNNKLKFHSLWDCLTQKLNELGPANKPAQSWREVWRNAKYKIKKDRKRARPSQSTESCNSNARDDRLLIQNFNYNGSKVLVLDEQNSARDELEKLKLQRDIIALEIAKCELELKNRQLNYNNYLQ